MVPKPQRRRPQLAAVDQSRQRQPDQVDHWTHSRRRTTASRRTPEVRKEKEACHRKEAKDRRPGTNCRGEESRTPPTRNHGSTNHGCFTPPERKLPLERTSQICTSNKTTTMTPTKIYPIPTSMTTGTIRTPHRVGQRHRPTTILFVDQNRCGSHIIWNNPTMEWRLSTNTDTWARSESSHPIDLGRTKTIRLRQSIPNLTRRCLSSRRVPWAVNDEVINS